MAQAHLSAVLRHLRRRAGANARDELSDGQLLERFAGRRDEAAFEALVERHGSMVLAACRRVLHDHHEAEDAFQATFLVLARKAAALDRRPSLSSWLFTVAYRLALKARAGAIRRRAPDVPTRPGPPDALSELTGRELCAALDEELHRLPEKYRAPLVLCCLEGKTRDEAARLLGWRPGALKGRLERGRDLLRGRLARRGLTLSAGLLGTLLSQADATALPAGLTATTVRAALHSAGAGAAGALADAGVRMLAASRLKAGVALMLILLTMAGAGLAARPRPGAAPDRPPAPAEEKPVVERRDGNGDALPEGALARLGGLRFRGDWDHLAFTPDGKAVAVQQGETLSLLNVASGRAIRRFPRPSSGPVAFSPDGKLLAATVGNMLALFDVATGRKLRDWIVGTSDLRLDTMEGVVGLLFAPDGKTLLATCGLSHGRWKLRRWDVATGDGRGAQDGDPGQQPFFGYSADGKFLIVLDGAGPAVRLLNAVWHNERRRVKLPSVPEAVAVAPGGRLLAFAEVGGAIHLLDPATGGHLRQLAGHRGGTQKLAFSADGKRLASAGADRTIRLWDATGRQELLRVPTDYGVYASLLWSPDGKLLAYTLRCQNAIHLLDSHTGRELHPPQGHSAEVFWAGFGKDGRTLLTAGRDGTVRFWERGRGREVRRITTGVVNGVWRAALSPDGKLLATTGCTEKAVRLWDSTTGKELRRVEGYQSVVAEVAFSPDDKLLASRSCGGVTDKDPGIRLWDVGTGKELRRLNEPRPPAYFTAMRYSADGKSLTTASSDGAVRRWGTASGEEIGGGTGPAKEVGPDRNEIPLAVSPDGRAVAARKHDGAARWSITVKEARTGGERVTLKGHTVYVACCAFSPDGRRLASGGGDGSVRLWDLATGKELACFAGHQGWVQTVAFAPDGRSLLSAGGDGTAVLWDVSRR
jgi:RNA polymerase sigma factor (sigma-70 family)